MNERLPLRTALISFAVGALVLVTLPWFGGGQEPVALLIDSGVLVAASILLWRAHQVRRLLWRWAPIWGTLLLAWAGASLIWSVNRYQTVMWVVLWGMGVLVFSLAYRASELTQARWWFARVYLASVAVMVVYGGYVYITSSYDRFTSSFYWANPAATYLIPALILLLAGPVIEIKHRWLRWWQPLLAGVVGAAFWLAASRGASLVLLITGLILVLAKLRFKTFWTQLLLTLIVAVMVVTGINYVRNNVTRPFTASQASSDLSKRLAEAARGESTSVKDRINYLKSATDIWSKWPLQGSGAGTFASLHPSYQKRVISASSSAHNVYVQTLAELGLVGAALLILSVGAVSWGVAKSAWYDPEVLPFALGFGALILHFGLDIDTTYPALVLLAAVLAGLSYQVWEVRRSRPSWPMPLFAVVLLVPVISLYQSATWSTNAAIVADNGDLETARDWNARAHTGLVYNPDSLTAEGIDDYALALGGQSRPANLQLALDRARAAQHQDPYDGQHWFLEGRSLALARRPAEAARAFQSAIVRDRYNHPEYYLQLSQVQLGQGQIDQAFATAESAIGQYPDNVLANRNLDPNITRSIAALYQITAIIRTTRGETDGANLDQARAARLNKSARVTGQ